MSDKDKVCELFQIWKFHRSRIQCDCVNHNPENSDVCQRELAWRAYVAARDEVIKDLKKSTIKKIDLRDVFQALEWEH